MSYRSRAVAVVARTGYLARGLVYLVVGSLALNAALEFEDAEDVTGALREIHRAQYGGTPVLFGLALGLAAYALWRAIQAVLDVDRHGRGPQALSIRGGLLVSAVLHTSMAWACVRIAMLASSGNEKPLQTAVSRTLDWPWGRTLVIAGGLAVAGAGVAHIVKAWRAGYRRWFDAPPLAMRVIDPISRVGLTVRGLIFVAMAAFVVYSAYTLDPSQARGMEGIMRWVQERLYGRLLLGTMACGLLAFGAYSIIEAVVRRVGLGPAAPR